MRVFLCSLLVACGAAPNVPCPTAVSAPASASAPIAEAPPSGPELKIVLHPVFAARPGASPKLAVELGVRGAGELGPLRLAIATSKLGALAARDKKGPIEARAQETAPGMTVTLARPPEGTLELSYELDASPNARASTSEIVVADDRFRAFAENVVLLPSALFEATCDVTVAIDGKAIHAPDAASSFGVGALRTRRARGRALLRAAFMAGSLGRAAFDTGSEHDEAAWLGYTAFDPRLVSAEIAEVRSALRELWKGGGDDAHTLLFVSSARPSGAYTMLPRASSLVLHVGPSESWSPALRVGVAQHLMQAWIGGELRVGTGDLEKLWLYEGVARFLAARVLSSGGLFTPEDARAFIVGLLSVQATSPHRGKPVTELATIARSDPRARARTWSRSARSTPRA